MVMFYFNQHPVSNSFFIATAPYADRGLVVGRVPFFWYDAELDIFQGDIESFTTASDISPKVYALNGYEHVSSMKSDPNNERLIYLDYQRQLIVALENFNTWVNTNITERVIQEGLSDTYHARIAYDWLTGNIYWTDNKYDWIAIKSVDHPDTSAYKILIHEGLRIPKAIAIDPIKRFLFYAEYGYSNTILMRSDLLGGDRKIIRSGLRWVSDMIADHHSSMLYWVDNTRLSVERSDYDGNHWEVIYRKSSNVFFTAIASYKNLVCMVDYYIQEVSCINKITGTVTWTTSYNYKFPWGMDAYAIDNHPQEAHPCQNYRCSDICINTNDGAKCICKEGYELEPNNPKNCIASNILKGKRLLFTNGTDVCMFDIRVLTGYKDNASCFMHWNGTINFIVVDTNRTKLFFHDESKSEIYSYDLKTKTSKNLVTSGSLSGLQYDWIGNALYWSESDIGAIKVASASMTDMTTTIIHNLDRPRNLEVYPHGRMLFWIAGTSNAPMIQSYSFDTQNVVTILNRATLKDPKALCYSAGHEKIMQFTTLVEIQSHQGTYMMELVGLFFQLIYRRSRPLLRWPLLIQIFNGKKLVNACETNNGGCEQICFATTYTDRECKCSFGFEIETNGLNCTSKCNDELKKILTKISTAITIEYQIEHLRTPSKLEVGPGAQKE
ncbi:hypothetical protein FSP39_021605 [Pinctada imbricata]|uniref:EGF-like domain-containing protein n=1 Tax=Pinctada imbricata TaxID=66713 RepID=A0AA89BVA3_PINIB|nr:hypothetical protein FSP39_021605 [Pinctada imbricata]